MIPRLTLLIPTLLIAVLSLCSPLAEARPLKLHAIFSDHMVIQRDKPIRVWGWADAGDRVSVTLGEEKAEATAGKGAGDDAGRWEVTFPARPAETEPVTLTAATGSEIVEFQNVVVGDVWILNGQSNMAWALKGIQNGQFEAAQADLPMLRFFSINPNQQSTQAVDIPAEKIPTNGWAISTPETAADFSGIGYVFGSRLQRALGVPIGLIKTARGGASIESLVPRHKFEDHPLAKRYAESVEKRMAAYDLDAEIEKKWQQEIEKARKANKPEDKWPKKSDISIRSWSQPGVSPSDMASVHNGMFGALKGAHIKGVLFHQGYNNMVRDCRPKRYRVLMKLAVEGWREEFNDPKLPVGVIGFCAGSVPQDEFNFESYGASLAPFIREAQRLGLADVEDQDNLIFIPAYDIQVPGLHPNKKLEHGLRSARWALAEIYKTSGVRWNTSKLVSAEPIGNEMVLTFSPRVGPDTHGRMARGFAIAGEDGKFYRAHARYGLKPNQRKTDSFGHFKSDVIHVWSPLVEKPVAVRYAWAYSPVGNLTVGPDPDIPYPSFRTDNWDLPESDDPDEALFSNRVKRDREKEADANLQYRLNEEAKRAGEILQWYRDAKIINE